MRERRLSVMTKGTYGTSIIASDDAGTEQIRRTTGDPHDPGG